MRSGTNQYHGSAYDYFVNEALNAGIPFTNDGKGHLLRPRQRRNDYGFSFGGAVKIPKLYDGHDKTFFFFNWEQFRETQSVVNGLQTVPTAAYRTGDFRAAQPLCSAATAAAACPNGIGGGQIVLQHLAERGAGPFSAAVCVSPMTGLHRGRAIRALSMLLALGGTRQTNYMPSTGPYDRAQRPFARNDVTSDERRYRFTDQWFKADPRLRLGGPTIGWLKQAQRSIDRLFSPGMLERISIPLVIMSAAADKVVDIASHTAAVARVRGATHWSVDGAKHEILMETDARRAQFWIAFDRVAASLG